MSRRLDEWLFGEVEYAAPRLDCPVWGRAVSIIRGFTLARHIVKSTCEELGGQYRVVVICRPWRGVTFRLSLLYDPAYPLVRRKRRRVQVRQVGLPQYIVDAIWELSAIYPVEVSSSGSILINGVEIDIERCVKRLSVDINCVLKQLGPHSRPVV